MAGMALLSARMLETLAGTVLSKWFTCPIFVTACGPLQETVGNGGRDGTFECADAGNTGNNRTSVVRSCVGSTGKSIFHCVGHVGCAEIPGQILRP